MSVVPVHGKEPPQLCPRCGTEVAPLAVACVCKSPLQDAEAHRSDLWVKRVCVGIALAAVLLGVAATFLPIYAYIGARSKNCGSVWSATFRTIEGPSCNEAAWHRLRGIAAATAAVALPALGVPYLLRRARRRAMVIVALYVIVLVYGASVWASSNSRSESAKRNAESACMSVRQAEALYFGASGVSRDQEENEKKQAAFEALMYRAEGLARKAADIDSKYEALAEAIARAPAIAPGTMHQGTIWTMCVEDERWN